MILAKNHLGTEQHEDAKKKLVNECTLRKKRSTPTKKNDVVAKQHVKAKPHFLDHIISTMCDFHDFGLT